MDSKASMFPHPYHGVPPTPLLPPEIACATVRGIEAMDAVGLDRDGRTRALAGVIAAHVMQAPDRTKAMADLVLIATRLAMGARS